MRSFRQCYIIILFLFYYGFFFGFIKFGNCGTFSLAYKNSFPLSSLHFSWRQYAAAALFHGRRLTGPSRKINQDMSNWEMEEEAEEQERQGQDEIDDDGTNFRGRRTTVTYRVGFGILREKGGREFY
jgi:hypothetical protein